MLGTYGHKLAKLSLVKQLLKAPSALIMSCLLLRDQNLKPIGNIQFNLRHVVQNAHRILKKMPSAGSCTGDKMCFTKTRDPIDELDSTANNAPGYSRCVNSSGGS
uniref:Phlebovirus glycoprotein G2 fusion domain-containing protein n=1 Tax=Ditylenchus dipsaci TaxID=166011 RepID=A0A915DP83_9BILA